MTAGWDARILLRMLGKAFTIKPFAIKPFTIKALTIKAFTIKLSTIVLIDDLGDDLGSGKDQASGRRIPSRMAESAVNRGRLAGRRIGSIR